MMMFWYPINFRQVDRAIFDKIKIQERNDTPNPLISTEIVRNYLTAITLLMNINYWTHHADDIIRLHEIAKACYVDEEYDDFEEMKTIAEHLFTHPTANQELNLHMAQYVTCTLWGLVSNTLPALSAYAIFRGLIGLASNYITRMGETRRHIDVFVSAINAIKPEERSPEMQLV